MVTLLLFNDWFSSECPESRPYVLVSSRENLDVVRLWTFIPVEMALQCGTCNLTKGHPRRMHM